MYTTAHYEQSRESPRENGVQATLQKVALASVALTIGICIGTYTSTPQSSQQTVELWTTRPVETLRTPSIRPHYQQPGHVAQPMSPTYGPRTSVMQATSSNDPEHTQPRRTPRAQQSRGALSGLGQSTVAGLALLVGGGLALLRKHAREKRQQQQLVLDGGNGLYLAMQGGPRRRNKFGPGSSSSGPGSGGSQGPPPARKDGSKPTFGPTGTSQLGLDDDDYNPLGAGLVMPTPSTTQNLGLNGAKPQGAKLGEIGGSRFVPGVGVVSGGPVDFDAAYEGGTYLPPSKKIIDLPEEEMLQTLRNRTQYWHQASLYIEDLLRKGVSPEKIQDRTDIAPIQQSLWRIQAQVYSTFVEDPRFTREILNFYDNPNCVVLNELRELLDEERAEAALWCAKQNADGTLAREVARAYKLMELFPDETEGFSNDPGDRLAFKYWRTAIEVQKSVPEKCEARAKEALKWVVTDSARERVQALLDGKLVGMLNVKSAQKQIVKDIQASLDITRLESQEYSWFNIPVLGTLTDVKGDAVLRTPMNRNMTLFNTFSPGPDTQWMTIPNSPQVKDAQRLCAILVPDIKSIGGEAVARKKGPVMLVVMPSEAKPDPEKFYIVTKQSLIAGLGGDETCTVASGGEVLSNPEGYNVVGVVLLAIQPYKSFE